MKHQRRILPVLALALAVLLTACGSQTKIRFGAAALGGNYHTFAQSLSSVLSSEADIETEVRATAGSAANIRLLDEDFIRLGLAQSDVISNMYSATGSFSGEEPRTGYSAVAGLYTEACQVVVRADSGITGIRDLRGKTVSVGESESGTEQNAREILAAYGLGGSMVTTVNKSYADAAEGLKAGEIDAFFCTVGIPTPVVASLSESCAIALLPIDGTEAAALQEAYGYYASCTVPAGTYAGQTADVPTLGVKSVLLASDKLSEGTVEAITRTLFENAGTLSYAIPVDFDLTVQSATEDVPIPFHPGAAAYYQAQGITVPTK